MLPGGKGTRVPFCCLLRSWIRLWFWLVARPTTFWLVCVRKCTWLDIFGPCLGGCLWVAACDCIVISMVHMPMWKMPLCGIDAMHRQLCGKDISNTTQHKRTSLAGRVPEALWHPTELWIVIVFFAFPPPPSLSCLCCAARFPLRRAHAKRFDKRVCVCVSKSCGA